MPSSVKGNSEQERELGLCFIAVIARVNYASFELTKDATYVFARFLDMAPEVLSFRVSNSSEWEQEVKDTYRYTTIGRIRSAARYLHAMAWTLLKSYGRDEDAAECFRLSDWFTETADRIVEEQKQLEEQGLAG